MHFFKNYVQIFAWQTLVVTIKGTERHKVEDMVAEVRKHKFIHSRYYKYRNACVIVFCNKATLTLSFIQSQ